jgi:hypothetical protein
LNIDGSHEFTIDSMKMRRIVFRILKKHLDDKTVKMSDFWHEEKYRKKEAVWQGGRVENVSRETFSIFLDYEQLFPPMRPGGLRSLFGLRASWSGCCLKAGIQFRGLRWRLQVNPCLARKPRWKFQTEEIPMTEVPLG